MTVSHVCVESQSFSDTECEDRESINIYHTH